ncbi:MAG: TAXI family TRAP transporter solute-binding subunit [Alphaproteobacteria bacterium]|nr:TAXI family TRAP transporter solute-binding subunit [Alphaproteobacteria bacterium]
MREFLKVYGIVIILVVAGFAVALRYVAPPPPDKIVFAAGAQGGSYLTFARKYAEILARDRIKVEIIETAGAVENLRRLNDPNGGIDVALMQGGVGSEEGSPGVVALGSIFYEPVWLAIRANLPVEKLHDLRGRRIAVGRDGSGTQILVRQVLRANGLDVTKDVDAQPIGTDASFEALRAHKIDAAFFVSAQAPGALVDLLAEGGFRLYSFDRHAAYKHLFPFLSSIVLPAGALDLARDIPGEETILLAPVAQLVAREDLHPALVQVLMRAAKEIHGPRQIFAPAGTFPTTRFVDFPLQEDSERLIERGPNFLARYLPFWAAVLVERSLVMLIPFVTLMIPLFRIAPPAYRWQIRAKIFSKYRTLRRIESDLRECVDANRRALLVEELDELQSKAGALKVPTGYADMLFNLRLHIRFVREIVASGGQISSQSQSIT